MRPVLLMFVSNPKHALTVALLQSKASDHVILMVQNHLVELVKQQFKSQNAVACIFVFIAITNFVAMAAYASQQQNIR